MQSKRTTIKLLSHTANMIETIYAEWVQSRTQDPVPMPQVISTQIDDERFHRNQHAQTRGVPGPIEAKVLDVFQKVVDMKMPLGETVDFVFLIEHCPVALREQLVRHRIGHKFGDRLGADIIPDLAGTSSFWSQTTRIVNMGTFATDGEFAEPYWLDEHGDKDMPGSPDADAIFAVLEKCEKYVNDRSPGGTSSALLEEIRRIRKSAHDSGDGKSIRKFYQQQMFWVQAAYRRLVKAGMPLEDARNLLPVAMQHRMTWKTNLSALMHVLSRRGCWLAQLGMWQPIIEGIVEELATKIHPSFRRLIDPPCIGADGRYNKCAFGKENEEIIMQGDYPPCTLWIHNNAEISVRDRNNGSGELAIVNEARMPRFRRMQERYTKLWHRDPRTGERLPLS